MNGIEKTLKDLEERREEIFKRFQADKGNPYWYEDWGCIIDDLDERIASLKKILEMKGKE